MAFIDKKDPVVLNIKLTSKGRELLAEGNLNFKYYAIGDSEMDYVFNNEVSTELAKIGQSYSPFYSHILRPADKNPSLLSFIPRDLNGDPYNLISNVPSIPTIIQNTVQPLGFFTIATGSTTFITDADHVKQPDVMVIISGVTGGTRLELKQAPTYLANVNEPEIGDLLLVKWTNPFGIDTTGYTVNTNYPTPYLIYKIQDKTGTLAANNLIVYVDRDLPNFNILSGGSNNILAGALIYYNYINYTGTSIYNDYSTDYVNEAIISFLQNCQCPTITFPFWNMTIIYTDNIAGIQPTDRQYVQYKSRTYGGFVSYIQNQEATIKKLGVIHYTNSSPSNTYGEELYQNTPVLELPTIMWHKSPTKTLGAKFKAYGQLKTLTGTTTLDDDESETGSFITTRSLNTNYYDLADLQGNVVGKVFIDLKLFVIEDQELLFAMSYKSNRSWTLPNYSVGINDNIIIGCSPCLLQYQITITSPTTIGGSNGSLYIHDLQNVQSVDNKVILEVSGITGILYYEPITGNTTITGLSAGTYNVAVYDLGSPNCIVTSGITLNNPTSLLSIYAITGTSSGLNPDFTLTQINPTNIIIYRNNIGDIYGTGYTAMKPYGVLPTNSDWVLFGGSPSKVEYAGLSFLSPYTFYVRDKINSVTGFTVSKNYVAAGNPLNVSFNTSQGSDSGGTYINVSNYLQTVVPSINPIVGNIELSIYHTNSVPTQWISGGTTGTGIAKKLYITDNPINYTTNYYSIAIRERQNQIVMYTVTKQITITS